MQSYGGIPPFRPLNMHTYHRPRQCGKPGSFEQRFFWAAGDMDGASFSMEFPCIANRKYHKRCNGDIQTTIYGTIHTQDGSSAFAVDGL